MWFVVRMPGNMYTQWDDCQISSHALLKFHYIHLIPLSSLDGVWVWDYFNYRVIAWLQTSSREFPPHVSGHSLDKECGRWLLLYHLGLSPVGVRLLSWTTRSFVLRKRSCPPHTPESYKLALYIIITHACNYYRLWSQWARKQFYPVATLKTTAATDQDV